MSKRQQEWFDVKKAAQVAAYFVQAEGGTINVLKLVKLIYIADRRNMDKHDLPITGDNFVSMDHGPVNSITLNLINGTAIDCSDWESALSSRSGHNVGLVTVGDGDRLSELSDAEVETLEEVWAEFGHMDRYQLRDWTHDNCPEWEDPQGSSSPIPFERIFKYLKKANPEQLDRQIKDMRALRAAYAN